MEYSFSVWSCRSASLITAGSCSRSVTVQSVQRRVVRILKCFRAATETAVQS